MGVEWELLPVWPGGRLVSFGGRGGVGRLFGNLAAGGYGAVRERRRIIALEPPGGGLVGLEPGAQVEMASPPVLRLGALETHLRKTGRDLQAGAARLGFELVPWGMAPYGGPEELPDVPKARYALLAEHLRRTGDRGRWMMKLTASTQFALDFLDEEHLRRMTDGALRLLPYLLAATANAPVAAGRRSGHATLRPLVWRRTDPARCGLPAHLFSKTLSAASLARYALGRPALFFVRAGRWVAGDGRSFREVLSRSGPLGPLTLDDWALHVSGLFPDLRMRAYLEVRALDSLPLPLVVGAAALLKGLLAPHRPSSWPRLLPEPRPAETRRELLRAARLGAAWAPVRGPRPAQVWPRLFAAAGKGLAALGERETLLSPLEVQVASGRCPAQEWTRGTGGLWRGPAAGL